MTPHAVLVVPAEGDPGGLLAAGPCGSAPPAVYRIPGEDWQPGLAPKPDRPPPKILRFALPLWWDGALVPEGWDRARRVYGVSCADYPDVIADRAYDTPLPGMQRLQALADMLVSHGLVASRVVRLALVDGRLVEVT